MIGTALLLFWFGTADSERARTKLPSGPKETVVVTAPAILPEIERRNGALFRATLFSRDDQLLDALGAGINAGQHEGGGKSVEVRRFGFNLDHGGVSGGLKVLVDGIQQNETTQGHGQGYLGALKSLTPELIQEVEVLSGPFSAEYGDFSGLGVVHIRLKESLEDLLTARIQGGSFGSVRAFASWSPKLDKGSTFLAYDGSRTDGPFLHPLGYRRDTVSGNTTRRLDPLRSLGFRFNASSNRFSSSGQIPLDEVASGRLDRFDALDPSAGGRTRSAVAGAHYARELGDGGRFRVDGFVARSLFDLYSNFTYFLNDEVNGDAIQQHDSRLQQGANLQYVHPHTLFGRPALLTAGGNFHDNQIAVGLYPARERVPLGVSSRAGAHVTNGGGYFQQGIDLGAGRIRLEAGARYDMFRFAVTDRIDPGSSGIRGAGRLQPKLNAAYRPTRRFPATLHYNYGRGISSQDARGIVQYRSSVPVATTDFHQAGVSYGSGRLSASAVAFLIDRSNEAVYVPDDGTIDFRGPSRAYGFEMRSSARIRRGLGFDASLTRVANAFYRGTAPRVYVERAPHLVASAALTFSGWRGTTASLRMRHAAGYRLDGVDATLRARPMTVVDLGASRRLRRWVDLNLTIDNLTNARYYETESFFLSRLRPGEAGLGRIHGTPGYPIGFSAGLTFRPFER